ncbi:MAG: TIGR01906 family membrane protein [Dehalococcoidia bacterium]|nr:TIGR01906 family membrane protein [Dehalococcoidia bacterium]
MRLLRGLATLVFLLALPVALLASNARLLANNLSFYQWGYERQASYESTGIPKEELDRATREMISDFNSADDFSKIQVRAGGRTFPLFNERDVVHLQDVRGLIQLNYLIQEISLAYLFVFSVAFLLRRNGRPMARLAWPWMLGGVFTTCLLIAVGLAMFLDFDRLFLQFHLVSFSNEFWMLDPATSYLIRMVPEGFFMDLAVSVAGLALVQAVALTAIAWGTLAWQKRSSFPHGTISLLSSL